MGNDNSVRVLTSLQWMMWVFGLFFCLLMVDSKDFPALKHIKSTTSSGVQQKTVMGLIERIAGERAGAFEVIINSTLGPEEKDTFNLVVEGNILTITGSSGVAASMGFYHYLEYYCKSQVTWAGQQISIPNILPPIGSPGITVTSPDRFRYYQNVCTVSYSMVWWSWARWEQEIDWMALHGINLPLAFTGQEAMFQRVYMSMGFTMDDLNAHFGGPAFLAWSRMGNIQGSWGGPLPQTWINNQLILQHKILERMRGFGMIPVLPGFAGHVPASITRLYPEAKVTRFGPWTRFNCTLSCTYLLDFNDTLFKQITKSFIAEMYYEFGVDHVYNIDSFNEMTPPSAEPAYFKAAGEAIFEALTAADPDAVWLKQGWLFQSSFWKKPMIEAFVTSVPKGRMIILDLFAELRPVYVKTESFFGQPFIWCMLQNFGGTMELFGNIQYVNEGPFTARNFTNSTMIGTGLTPEGIFENEVMFEFMTENAWRTKPRNITLWISEFVERRYEQTNEYIDKAWQLLKRSVYSANAIHHGKNGFIKRPRLKMINAQSVFNSTTQNKNNDGTGTIISHLPSVLQPLSPVTSVYSSTGSNVNGGGGTIFTNLPKLEPPLAPPVWYKPEDLYEAWDNFIYIADELANNTLFRYDLVDVTRNSLQILSIKYYTELIAGYHNSDPELVKLAGSNLQTLLLDLDSLLGSDKHFLLGNWLEDAKACGMDQQEKTLLEYDARNQITTWGPNQEILDYAAKQWSGLMKSYSLPRWKLFVDMLYSCVVNKTQFDDYVFKRDVFQKVEQPFTFSQDTYPTTPTGDSVKISREMYTKYRPETYSEFFKKLPEISRKQMKKHRSRNNWRGYMSFEML